INIYTKAKQILVFLKGNQDALFNDKNKLTFADLMRKNKLTKKDRIILTAVLKSIASHDQLVMKFESDSAMTAAQQSDEGVFPNIESLWYKIVDLYNA